jgi:hypothetical protein
MGLTMSEKRAVAAQMAAGYQRARKKEKGEILGQFVELTGYVRRYGARLLREHGKKTRVGTTTIIGDLTKKAGRKRQPIYDGEVVDALRKIWMIMDCICGKRLKAALADLIPVLKKNMEIRLNRETEEKLLEISASTIDRLLAAERKKQLLKGRSGTKPGSLLKHQIKIRTFSEWNERKPGFVEIDLVGHDGGDATASSVRVWMSPTCALRGPKPGLYRTRLRYGYSRRSLISERLCPSNSLVLTQITAVNSSTTSSTDTVSRSRSLSHEPGPHVRTTPVLWKRRTIRW